jgi:DNA uptake protein ComE-like DNA-binding protein
MDARKMGLKHLWMRPAILAATLGIGAAVVGVSGCTRGPQTDQQVQQQAAQDTEKVKQGAKEAAADAKIAAANAERSVNDIAAGVKEGLHSNAGSSSSGMMAGSVDINSANEDQLVELPGISGVRARRIIAHRPYGSAHGLVDKGVLSEAEYGRISGQIVAR